MLILDTNILYYANGLSQCRKKTGEVLTQEDINDFIDKNKGSNELFISSVSFFEIIARFHTEINTIHKVVDYLKTHRIKIKDNGYFCKVASQQEFFDGISKEDLDPIWEKIKENKVDVESKYATVVFLLIFLSDIVFECNIDIKNISEQFYRALGAISQCVRSLMLEMFKRAFEKGYDTDDCENEIKNQFDAYFFCIIPPTISVCKELLSSPSCVASDFSGITSQIEKEIEEHQDAIEKKTTSIQYFHKQAMEYRKNFGQKSYDEYLKNFNEIFKALIPEVTMQEYLTDLVCLSITDSRAFWKNDIIDALILSALTEDDLVLTLDDGAIKHLEKYKGVRPEYEKSLNLINLLK